MNKPNRNFFLVLALILSVSLLLLSCQLTATAPTGPAATNPGAGSLGGGAQVSVSDGVILLTPGQPLPTLDINQLPGLTPVAGTGTPNPNATPPLGTSSGNSGQGGEAQIAFSLTKALGNEQTSSVYPSYSLSTDEITPSATGSGNTSLQADVQNANVHFVLTKNGQKSDVLLFGGNAYAIVNGKAQPGSATSKMDWVSWPLDSAAILGAAVAANPQPQGSDNLEGRSADKYAIDSSTLQTVLPDTSMGLLPYRVTAIQGTIWIDHETGGLLKCDLTFAADVKKPGDTKPSIHGKGELHILFHQIGQVTVSMPQ